MKKELKTTIYETVANTKEKREVGRSRAQNYLAEPSSAPERKTHGQTLSNVAQLSGGREKLYSVVVVGRTTQKVYKPTVTSRDNQTAETIN